MLGLQKCKEALDIFSPLSVAWSKNINPAYFGRQIECHEKKTLEN